MEMVARHVRYLRTELSHQVRRMAEVAPPVSQLLAVRRVRRRMQAALGYVPDLRNPRTFNEKIAWRMLHDRNPLFPLTIDKLAVRDWVAAKVGPDILIPLIGAWERPCQVDWEVLPPRFVLKASHGWNMNLLVHDKLATSRNETLNKAASWLQMNHYDETDEWGYRDIPPRLLAEEMLLDEAGDIAPDLKFYVFHGRVRLLRVHTGRFGCHRVTFLNENMKRLPLTIARPPDPDWVPSAEIRELLRIAELLGAEFDHVRVDLYLVRGVPRFGELTHYDTSACSAYYPGEFDRIIGDMWQLPGAGTDR